MYLVGEAHPNKTAARRALEGLVAREEALVSDVEVLQEILHRYRSISRIDAIQPAFDVLLGLVDEVLPIELPHVERAKQIVMGAGRLSARDALHVAVMESVGVRRVLSYDSGFDAVPGLQRVT